MQSVGLRELRHQEGVSESHRFHRLRLIEVRESGQRTTRFRVWGG